MAAFALAAVAVVAIATATGWQEFGQAWSRVDPAWIAVAGCAQAAAFLGYGLAYRSVARVHGGPQLRPPLVARLVAAGFGASAIAGGFAIDQRAFDAIDDDTHEATVRVLGLGALEWALLAPAAWISAVVLLASGESDAMPSLLWPWAIAVPVGFGVGLWLSHPGRGLRDSRRRAVRVVLRGIGVLHTLAREPRRYAGAWLGVGAYWALDILSLYRATATPWPLAGDASGAALWAPPGRAPVHRPERQEHALHRQADPERGQPHVEGEPRQAEQVERSALPWLAAGICFKTVC
jgi:uncharacterized membrane protein YbhN (UPF0104 family)